MTDSRGMTSIDGDLDLTCLAMRTVPAEVRQRIQFRLDAWRLPGIADDLQLIVAELVSNACTETPNESIRIQLKRELRSVLFGVWDGSNRLPEVRRSQELTLETLDLSPDHYDDNGGWGLPIVQSLATECGVNPTRPSGKWVWARLATAR
jgi:anti-sigma regulatory factor (Ser/Thr protein kinase)